MNELALGMRIAVDSPKGMCGFMGTREVKSLETCYFFTVFSFAMVLNYVGFFYWDFSCCYPIDVFKKECKNAILDLNIVILIDKKKFIQSLDDLFLSREFHF